MSPIRPTFLLAMPLWCALMFTTTGQALATPPPPPVVEPPQTYLAVTGNAVLSYPIYRTLEGSSLNPHYGSGCSAMPSSKGCTGAVSDDEKRKRSLQTHEYAEERGATVVRTFQGWQRGWLLEVDMSALPVEVQRDVLRHHALEKAWVEICATYEIRYAGMTPDEHDAVYVASMPQRARMFVAHPNVTVGSIASVSMPAEAKATMD